MCNDRTGKAIVWKWQLIQRCDFKHGGSFSEKKGSFLTFQFIAELLISQDKNVAIEVTCLFKNGSHDTDFQNIKICNEDEWCNSETKKSCNFFFIPFYLSKKTRSVILKQQLYLSALLKKSQKPAWFFRVQITNLSICLNPKQVT